MFCLFFLKVFPSHNWYSARCIFTTTPFQTFLFSIPNYSNWILCKLDLGNLVAISVHVYTVADEVSGSWYSGQAVQMFCEVSAHPKSYSIYEMTTEGQRYVKMDCCDLSLSSIDAWAQVSVASDPGPLTLGVITPPTDRPISIFGILVRFWNLNF